MKLKLSLVAACIAIASLTACGGGSDDPAPSVPVYSPATLTKIDSKIGEGVEAVNGKTVKVHYTGWLYTTTVANNKGKQFDSSAGKAPYPFTLGANQVIAGFDLGVLGMKVGGKRTVLIPAAQAYGTRGSPPDIPPNSGVVFDIELMEVN